MTDQASFRWRDPERPRRLWRVIRSAVRLSMEQRGIKAAADDMGMTHSELSNKLEERDRHRLHGEELAQAMIDDTAASVLYAMCDELGYERPQRRRELSPQEKLDKLNAALDANPELASVIRRRAGV